MEREKPVDKGTAEGSVKRGMKSGAKNKQGQGVKKANRGSASSGAQTVLPKKGKSRPSGQTQKKPSNKMKRQTISKRTFLIIAAIFAVAITVCMISGYAVIKSEKIFPHVIFEEVDIGGLTVTQAQAKLKDAGIVGYAGKVVTIAFPTRDTLEIAADEAGVIGEPEDATKLGYTYGRDGNIIKGLGSYVSTFFHPPKFEVQDLYTIDEAFIRERISAKVKAVNVKLKETGVNIQDDYIILYKGADDIIIDENKVYDMISDAFRTQNFEPIKYIPEQNGDGTIDMQALYDTVYQDVENAVYDKETDTVIEHKNGISFDVEQAKSLWNAAALGDEVRIPLTITEAEMTAEYLNEVLFADVLAQKTTNLTWSAPRNNNITLASKAINGLVLNPGEEFSYNAVVGQRTTESGYKAAGAYSDGKVVNEVGGGICQVSSTLYYTQLLANLETVERYCHYFRVDYLPAGLDATVSWPSPNYRFSNNRDLPIKIQAYTDLNNMTLTIKILGTDIDGSYVKLDTETWKTETGTGATSYRLIYDKDGNLIEKKKESSSQYHYHTSANPEQTAPSTTQASKPSSTAVPSATEAPVVPTAPQSTQTPVTPQPTPAAPATEKPSEPQEPQQPQVPSPPEQPESVEETGDQ